MSTKSPGKLSTKLSAFEQNTGSSVPSAFAHAVSDTKKLGMRKFTPRKKFVKPDIGVASKNSNLEGLSDVIAKVKKEDVPITSGEIIRKHRVTRQLASVKIAEDNTDAKNDNSNTKPGGNGTKISDWRQARLADYKRRTEEETIRRFEKEAGGTRRSPASRTSLAAGKPGAKSKNFFLSRIDDAIAEGPTEEAKKKSAVTASKMDASLSLQESTLPSTPRSYARKMSSKVAEKKSRSSPSSPRSKSVQVSDVPSDENDTSTSATGVPSPAPSTSRPEMHSESMKAEAEPSSEEVKTEQQVEDSQRAITLNSPKVASSTPAVEQQSFTKKLKTTTKKPAKPNPPIEHGGVPRNARIGQPNAVPQESNDVDSESESTVSAQDIWNDIQHGLLEDYAPAMTPREGSIGSDGEIMMSLMGELSTGLDQCHRMLAENSSKLQDILEETRIELEDARKSYANEKESLRQEYEERIQRLRQVNEKQLKKDQQALSKEKSVVDELQADNKRLRATMEKLPIQAADVLTSSNSLEKANEEIEGHMTTLKQFLEKLESDHTRLEESNRECKDVYLPRYRSELRERQSLIETEKKIKNLYKTVIYKIGAAVDKSKNATLIESIRDLILETEQEVNPKFDPRQIFAAESDSSSDSDSSDSSSDGESDSDSDSDSP